MRHNSLLTYKKYSAFINDCRQQKTFSFKQMKEKHKVDASLVTTMTQLKLIVSSGYGNFNWIGVGQVDFENIIETHRARLREYKKQREGKGNKVTLRRVEVVDRERTPVITEQQAVDFLKSIGGYEIYKVNRHQL